MTAKTTARRHVDSRRRPGEALLPLSPTPIDAAHHVVAPSEIRPETDSNNQWRCNAHRRWYIERLWGG